MNAAVRLTDFQLTCIKQTFQQHFLKADRLWLFGSRTDPHKKGGDIDLYVETHCDDMALIVEKEINFLVDLKKKMGDQKIDLVINSLKKDQKLPIYDEAKSTGIKLA